MGMNEQDELRDRAARIAYEIEVQNYGGYDWETAKADAGKDVGPFEFAPPLYELDMAYEIADGIIALVRADEQRRIAAAIDAEYEKVKAENTDIMGGYDLETAGVLEGLGFAFAATGITVEDDQP